MSDGIVTVKKVLAMNGVWVTVWVQRNQVADYGPYSEDEADACIEGMKAFASKFTTQFKP